MTLRDLIEQVQDDVDITFEINFEEYGDWDMFDVVWGQSTLLLPFYDREISCLTAIKQDTFRFCLKEKIASILDDTGEDG